MKESRELGAPGRWDRLGSRRGDEAAQHQKEYSLGVFCPTICKYLPSVILQLMRRVVENQNSEIYLPHHFFGFFCSGHNLNSEEKPWS